MANRINEFIEEEFSNTIITSKYLNEIEQLCSNDKVALKGIYTLYFYNNLKFYAMSLFIFAITLSAFTNIFMVILISVISYILHTIYEYGIFAKLIGKRKAVIYLRIKLQFEKNEFLINDELEIYKRGYKVDRYF